MDAQWRALAAASSSSIELDDLDDGAIELRRNVVKFESDVESYPFGIRAEILDPDGNRISLRQRATRA